MIAGRIDIANASRAVKDSEKADCEKNNIELLELLVALDGLEMLVQQGAAALELWLQRPVPVATMRQALVNGLDKR